MSAQAIYDHALVGALVTYSDGAPRPPERFKHKLRAWKNRNGSGRLIEKRPVRTDGYLLPASFTLHEADLVSGGVVVVRCHRCFDVSSELFFEIVPEHGVSEPSQPWTVQCSYAGYFANTVTVEADSAEEACRLAVDAANVSDGWRSLDHCGPTFVDALAPGEDIHPWTREGSVLLVPERFTEAGVLAACEGA